MGRPTEGDNWIASCAGYNTAPFKVGLQYWWLIWVNQDIVQHLCCVFYNL